MSKGARIKQARKDKTDRAHTLVTKETKLKKMHNPGNVEKAKRLREIG